MNSNIATIITTCHTCQLSDLCLPYGLNVNEIESLEHIIRNKRPLQAKQLLYSKGDECKSLYVVKSGGFRSFLINAEGSEQTINFYLPGELMGLDALFSGSFCSSIDALVTSAVCELPLNRLNELCDIIPNLQHQMTRVLSKEISHNHDQLVLFGNNSAKIKLASFLLILSKRYELLGCSSTEFNLTMRRHDIANFLSLSDETVSRQFTALSKDKIISVNQRAIKILDLDLLKSIVEHSEEEDSLFFNKRASKAM